ncbi:hypothetical protein F8M41_021924 [Gigaspora margarita]|uniref:F-box domain-containing protein n=1 Tax=Gigaspora margarita TaxID=4874 RepID=A0A8H4ETS7_GIGMA|nr:hypothetical protein F8M41_021924 [Gigaspora margarita]
MITLPNECLLEIFDNLQTYNGILLYKNLFSCLLVNRQWCRVIIPILWSKPALYDKRFIRICILSLNLKEQAQLIPFNINLPNNPTPLFEYTSYISHLTSFHDNLELGIKRWLETDSHPPTSKSFTLKSAIKCSLITMFLRTSGRLKYLSFSGSIYNKSMVIEHICNTLTYLSLQYNCLNSEDGIAIAKYLWRDLPINTYLY